VACAASRLSVGQTPLSEGGGEYYLAWSLTNTGGDSCTLPVSHPTLALENAAGRSVQAYSVTDAPPTSSTSIDVVAGGKAWFLTEESAAACPAPQTVTGGPFHYAIGLGGSTGTATWSPSYLQADRVPDLCTRVDVAVGALQGTEPTP
jgi:hypothetical protein